MGDYNAIRKAISEKYIASFVGRIMLSYSFSTTELYNVLHSLEFSIGSEVTNSDWYDRTYQTGRSYRRVERISARLAKETVECAGAIYKPKIYDQEMFAELPNSYNQLVTMINRPPITVVTENYLQRADLNDAYLLSRYNDELVECAYCVDLSMIERKGLTLPELMLYVSLYMSTHSRSIQTLNKPLVKKSDYLRAVRWYERTIDYLTSSAVYEAVIHELMDMLFFEIMGNYIDICKQNIHEYWMDEKFRNRKDRDRVLRKLDKMERDGNISRVYLVQKLEMHPEWIPLFFEQVETISIAERLLWNVLFVAELMILGMVPDNLLANDHQVDLSEYMEKVLLLPGHRYPRRCLTDFSIEENDYKLAIWLAHLIQSMMEQGKRITYTLMDCFPESEAWKRIE